LTMLAANAMVRLNARELRAMPLMVHGRSIR
jgi:hypothetical protein